MELKVGVYNYFQRLTFTLYRCHIYKFLLYEKLFFTKKKLVLVF